jgi:hypothetical protein
MATPTTGNLSTLNVIDKTGNQYTLSPVDSQARQEIANAKNLQFDDNYFTATEDNINNEVNIGLSSVQSFGVQSPLTIVQDTENTLIIGSDAPFAKAVAPEYDPTATYPTVGTAVMYKGLRYESNTPINAAEAWTAAHWDFVSIDDVIGNIETLLAAL